MTEDASPAPATAPDGTAQGRGGEAHESLTLELLLAEPLLRSSAVFAAGDDGSRRVEWCLPLADTMADEAPLDGVVVVARGDLLAQPVEAVDAQLNRLHHGGAVALMILGVRSEPGRMEQFAERSRLPLVLAPPDVGFHAINRIVAEKRLVQDAHVMAYGVSVHRELADVLYRGSGLSAMARRISRLSSCPAFLLDTELAVLAYESLGAAAVPDPDELIRMLRERLTVDGAFAHDGGAGGHGRSAPVEVRLEHQTVSVVVAPIVLGGTTYGWVAIVELDHPPLAHDMAQHLVVAEQAAMISGSEMLRLRSVEEAEERARGDFVHALLHGRFANPHELRIRAAHHEFDVDGAYAVVVARGALDAATTQGLARQMNVIRTAQQLQPEPGLTTMATAVGDLLVVVRKVGPGRRRSRDGKSEHEAIGAFANGLAAALGTLPSDTVQVAFGRPAVGAAGIMSSYREARYALEVAGRLNQDGVAGYADLQVFAVLSQVAQDPDGIAFAREVFDPLNEPGERGGDLELVLMAYIESGGNLNAAARQMFMHRNTVLYKLDKASRLLGMDLRSAENQFTLWLAHRIRVLADVEATLDREISPTT